MTTPVLRFKNDGPKRKLLWVDGAMAHPAKGHIAMWEEMVLRYSKEGDTVLDPMGGIGTSMIAALMGRNVVLVELESHFVEPMRASWEKMKQHPMLGYTMGQVTILQGDARKLPLPDACVTGVVTSPPFEGIVAMQDRVFNEKKAIQTGRDPNSAHALGITGYTRPQVDTILTSPPYEGLRQDGGVNDLSLTKQDFHSYTDGITTRGHEARGGENIGNLRGAAYWEAQSAVYRECFRVLKPGGLMALVLKGFTRDGKYVDLPSQTEALLLEEGWVKHDEWLRELWSLSFWRILQQRRDPAAFDERLKFETVLAFRKPEGQGNGVDAVITSPPYEGHTSANDEQRFAASGKPFTERSKREYDYTRPVDAIITSPPYEGTGLQDMNASPLNGPIGNASRRKDKRPGAEDNLSLGNKGYTRSLETT